MKIKIHWLTNLIINQGIERVDQSIYTEPEKIIGYDFLSKQNIIAHMDVERLKYTLLGMKRYKFRIKLTVLSQVHPDHGIRTSEPFIRWFDNEMNYLVALKAVVSEIMGRMYSFKKKTDIVPIK